MDSKLREKLVKIFKDRSINVDFLRINKEKNADDLAEGLADQVVSLIRQHIPEDRVKAVKEILAKGREGIKITWGPSANFVEYPISIEKLAQQICQLLKIKLPKAREYNYMVDRCISEHGIFRAGEEYILQQIRELNDMEVEG